MDSVDDLLKRIAQAICPDPGLQALLKQDLQPALDGQLEKVLREERNAKARARRAAKKALLANSEHGAAVTAAAPPAIPTPEKIEHG